MPYYRDMCDKCGSSIHYCTGVRSVDMDTVSSDWYEYYDDICPFCMYTWELSNICSDYADDIWLGDITYEINKDWNPEQKIIEGQKTKSISLNNFGLLSIPEDVLSCPGIKELDLSNNRLTEIQSKCFANNPEMERLSINNNKIKIIPENIEMLNSLKVLNISNNEIKTLPESIIKLSNLKIILVENNPLEKPPLEIANQGIEAIKKWFESEDKISFYEAKMVLVGNTGVGKTTLRENLLDSNYRLTSHPSTHGLEIKHWDLQISTNEFQGIEFIDNSTFRLNVWDFGGQGKYRSVQQFFCSRNSLYLFVTEPDDEEIHKDDNYAGFFFWLSFVSALSYDRDRNDQSPVIYIMNKAEEGKSDYINEEQLRAKFNNVKVFQKISCKTGEGLDALKNKIKKVLPLVSHDIFTRKYSRNWLAVKENLEKQEINYITYEQYEAICKSHNLTIEENLQSEHEISEAEIWLNVLDSIGTVIHFSEIRNLRNIIVLKPDWVKQAAYAVLDCPKVIANEGEFTDKDFRIIWQNKQFTKSDYDRLIELMKAFELCYEKKDDGTVYFVPSLFADNPTQEIDLKRFGNLEDYGLVRIECHYNPFMPAGVIGKLIVNKYELIYNDIKWKTGVVFYLKDQNTYAEISEKWKEYKITITLCGQRVKALLNIILDELEKINERIKKAKYLAELEIEHKVLCCCKKVDKPCSFDYRKLLNKLEKGKLMQECNNDSLKEVVISELLMGMGGHDKRTTPMPSLDKSNIHKIVDLLTPLMERENERRALLILALGHDALLLRQLDLTGAVEPFLVNMIKALVDYGEVAPGKQALWALLEVVREHVGVNRQAKIDALYSVINALGQNDGLDHRFGHSNRQISDLGMQDQPRLNKKIDDSRRQWKLLNEKLGGLNEQWILETRFEEKFRLKKLIEDTKIQRDQIEEQLKEMESQLAKVDSDAKEVATIAQTRFSRNDEETAKALYVCFDRPAFRQSFEHESDFEALIAALDDTIAAINTGVKKRRDGIVFDAPVKGKAYFDSSELYDAFDQIVVLLSKAKTLYSKAKRDGYFFFGVRSGGAFHSAHQGEAAWVAIRIDELRNEALKVANHVYGQMGMRLFPYIGTPGYYQRFVTHPPFAEDESGWLPKADDKEVIEMTSILFLAADPTDASRLRLGEEFREIYEKLKLAQLRDRFKLEIPQLSVRPADISQALLDVQPRIVHFSGHGTSTGALCFENQSGQTHIVQPDALAALFEQFANQVNCVLLNACYSETQAKAIAEHIEHVIGMNQAIGDKAAIAFAIGFYQALGAGRTIEDAYKLGCVQIRLQGIPEHLTPVLIKKVATQP